MKCKRITFAMFHIAVTLTHFSSHSFYFCLSCQPNQSIFFIPTSFNPCPLSFSSFSFFSVVERCYLDSCLFVFFQLLKRSSWSPNTKKNNEEFIIMSFYREKVQESKFLTKHTRISDFLFILILDHIHWTTQWISTAVMCVRSPMPSLKYHISDLIFANHRDMKWFMPKNRNANIDPQFRRFYSHQINSFVQLESWTADSVDFGKFPLFREKNRLIIFTWSGKMRKNLDQSSRLTAANLNPFR